VHLSLPMILLSEKSYSANPIPHSPESPTQMLPSLDSFLMHSTKEISPVLGLPKILSSFP
jgi:hypothetical protein